MTLQISAIYQAQYVASGGVAKLTFTTLNAILAGGTVVPANTQVLLTSLVVINTTNTVATIALYRGTAGTQQFTLLYTQNLAPGQSLQVLSAPIVLMAGDAIWGLAGTAAAINVTGDGEVLVQ